jgi:diacylglycerol kinase
MKTKPDLSSTPPRNAFQPFWDAGRGLSYLFRTQRNIRIHLLVAIAAVGLGVWLGLERSEWAILTLTIGLVFGAEAMNTAIEAVIDLVQPTYHPLAGAAKDVAAGGVLIAALIAVVVGILLFGPRLLLHFFALLWLPWN